MQPLSSEQTRAAEQFLRQNYPDGTARNYDLWWLICSIRRQARRSGAPQGPFVVRRRSRRKPRVHSLVPGSASIEVCPQLPALELSVISSEEYLELLCMHI